LSGSRKAGLAISGLLMMKQPDAEFKLGYRYLFSLIEAGAYRPCISAQDARVA